MKNLNKTLSGILIATVGVNITIGIIEPYLTIEASNIWYTLIGLSYITVGIWLPIRILSDK